jgi:hypothetical protein
MLMTQDSDDSGCFWSGDDDSSICWWLSLFLVQDTDGSMKVSFLYKILIVEGWDGLGCSCWGCWWLRVLMVQDAHDEDAYGWWYWWFRMLLLRMLMAEGTNGSGCSYWKFSKGFFWQAALLCFKSKRSFLVLVFISMCFPFDELLALGRRFLLRADGFS